MRDLWANKIVAGVITLGVGLMCVWTISTVQQHETTVARQALQIQGLQVEIKNLSESIKEALSDIKSDLRELKKEARRRNPNFETGENK